MAAIRAFCETGTCLPYRVVSSDNARRIYDWHSYQSNHQKLQRKFSLQKNGNWVTAAGIQGPKSAFLIDNRDGKGEVLTGSLFNAPEHYSGFWIIETSSEEEARKLALAGSRACNRRVELRPFIQ
ncbi:MAG: hypothetical protein EBW15_09115 [Actinobacteria bacterium]|nr:hypothetical protein [Actinomycetota bacterium]